MPDVNSDRLTAALRRLPEPTTPATIEATVMARVARLPVPAPDLSREPARRRRELAAGVWAIAGLLLVLGLTLYEQITISLPPGVGLTPSMTVGLDRMPSGGPAISLLALGLLLYAAGLFGQAGGGGTARKVR